MREGASVDVFKQANENGNERSRNLYNNILIRLHLRFSKSIWSWICAIRMVILAMQIGYGKNGLIIHSIYLLLSPQNNLGFIFFPSPMDKIFIL